MSKDKTHTFSGKDIDVLWDKRLCIHVAECGLADNELFDGDRKPWCDPDTTSKDDVAEVCERCPSGALTYRDKSGKLHETAPAANTVSVICDGPLYLHGDLAIYGAPDDMPGVAFRAALCVAVVNQKTSRSVTTATATAAFATPARSALRVRAATRAAVGSRFNPSRTGRWS